MMISKKVIYVAAAIVLVGATGIILRIVFFGGSGQTGNREAVSGSVEPNTYNISKLVNIPSGDTLSIGTPRGSVSVKNFYRTALGGEEQFVIIKKGDNFEINYDTYTSGFAIYISGVPLEANRELAEKSFLDALDITKQDACKLAVFEGVSPDVDKSSAGRNLGLSFCMGIL